MTTQTLKNKIEASNFSNDPELQSILLTLSNVSDSEPYAIKMFNKMITKRLITLKKGSINLPSSVGYSNSKLIEEYLLSNYSKDSINDANGYKGLYFINDNTPQEIRIYFYTDFNKNLFVTVNKETYSL